MALNWLRKIGASGEETCCCPECEAEVDAAVTQCSSCGYDIVQQAKVDLSRPPMPGAG